MRGHRPRARPSSSCAAIALVRGHRPLARPSSSCAAIVLLRGHRPRARPSSSCTAIVLLRGHRPLARPSSSCAAIVHMRGHRPHARPSSACAVIVMRGISLMRGHRFRHDCSQYPRMRRKCYLHINPILQKTLPRLRRRSLAPDLRNPSHETWKRPGCLLSCLLLRFMKCGIFWSQPEIVSALVHPVMNQQQEMEVDSRFKLERVPDNDIRNGTGASIRRGVGLWESQYFSSADLETISCLSKVFSSSFSTNRPSSQR